MTGGTKMHELRCRPGDLAIVIYAKNVSNLGRIVRVIQRDDGSGAFRYGESIPAWLAESPTPMTWYVNKKRYRRKRGPIPDAHLQPIRGKPHAKNIAEALRDIPGVLLPITNENIL